MRMQSTYRLTRSAGLLLTGLALAACDPTILLGDFLDSDSGDGQEDGGQEGSGPSEGGQEDGGQEDSGQEDSGQEGSGSSQGGEDGGADTGEGSTFIVNTTAEEETGGGFECSTWAQDCPVGEKCNAYSNQGDGPTFDALKCVDVAPTPQPVGAACSLTGAFASGEDDCELGATCWDVDPVTNQGTCVAFCGGSIESPSCATGSSCILLNDGVLSVCLPDCDVLAQDCAAGQTCVPRPDSPGSICVLDASGAEGQAFDECSYLNACDPGLVCFDPALASECSQADPGCCLPFCDLSAPSCPGVGQVCLPYYDPPQAGQENLGICGLEP